MCRFSAHYENHDCQVISSLMSELVSDVEDHTDEYGFFTVCTALHHRNKKLHKHDATKYPAKGQGDSC